jgi:unsaturated chondroitin disaccharide hydrolase
MISIQQNLSIADLKAKIDHFWVLSGQKILAIEQNYDFTKGTPVFTVAGKYSTRGWTEWTQGFQYGSAILQFDATGDEQFLNIGRKNTIEKMATHISHIGVHDHGFNNVSTYGNLHRLMHEGKIEFNQQEKEFYELALKISGAVQATRWTEIKNGGFIHSFNGPHSLFVDTIRSCRALMMSHLLGHELQAENDIKISLLDRAIQHILATAKYAVYYGEGRDTYDIWGRTAHESIFNIKDGNYRCPNSQQGYTGFSTWTRGLAWAMSGFAEQLELLSAMKNDKGVVIPGDTIETIIKAATATCDFYLEHTPTDGIPYWDTEAPFLYKIENYLEKEANPYNDFEPVDSSAAAIAAQGLLRFGKYLKENNQAEKGVTYWQAGLTIANRLLEKPYLSESTDHEGLILHSIYHRPNGWDYIPRGSKIPNGESSMWGDYHARELVLYLHKLAKGEKYYTFFEGVLQTKT